MIFVSHRPCIYRPCISLSSSTFPLPNLCLCSVHGSYEIIECKKCKVFPTYASELPVKHENVTAVAIASGTLGPASPQTGTFCRLCAVRHDNIFSCPKLYPVAPSESGKCDGSKPCPTSPTVEAGPGTQSNCTKSSPSPPPDVCTKSSFGNLKAVIGEDFEEDFEDAIIQAGFKNEKKLLSYFHDYLKDEDGLKAQILSDIKLPPIDAQILARALSRLPI